jgi:hypothetical protein
LIQKLQRNFSREFYGNSYYIIGKSTNFHVLLSIPTYRLCLTVLRYKGQQVEKQREEIEMLGKASSLNKFLMNCS